MKPQRCICVGLYQGHCSGKNIPLSSQGHALCEGHQKVLRAGHEISLGGGFWIRYFDTEVCDAETPNARR
jgi:hypothetical protein